MESRTVHLSDGDVGKIEVEGDMLKIYDSLTEDVLIQAKLTDEERSNLINALGGIPIKLGI